MEFTLDCENIQIIIKNAPKLSNSSKHLIIKNDLENLEEYQENIDSTELISAEVLIKLNNYFLINNIKLSGEIEEFCIKNIEYQNIKTGLWENIPYYNPDKDETIIKDSDSLSIFCVGLTQFLKINILLQGMNFSNRTLTTQIEQNRIRKNINNELINGSNQRHNSSHNQSMQDHIGRNLNMSSLPRNSCSNIKSSSDNENELIYVSHLKNMLKKVSIFAQYIFSLPNSTYLLTLLNISNYFLINNSVDSYLLSIYLTANSMTQARLFIQAWELFNKIQFTIINNKNQVFYLKYLFDSNSHSLIASDDNKMSYFLAKIEILKATCMYEYGQINSFLESLKNSLNFFYKNDFSSMKSSISWSKNTEINYNKFYIQNYLSRFHTQLIDFLFILLKDKSEIVILYSLKTIEFLLDYCIHNVSKYIPKLVKALFKLIAPMKKGKFNQESLKEELLISITSLNESFNSKNVHFPEVLLDRYLSENNEKNKILVSGEKLTNEETMNPILIKQINYTFDTLINNLDALSSEDLLKIMNNNQIIEMLSYNSDSITKINIMKFIKKTMEINNSKIKFTPELIIKIFDKGLDLSQNNIKAILAYNNNFSSHKSNVFHIKKFDLLEFKMLENNDFGELISTISDLFSEEKFLFSNYQDTKDIINWISESLEITLQYINEVNRQNSSTTNESQKQILDFAMFYSVLLFYLLESFFLKKLDIKTGLYDIMINNMQVVVANNLEKLLNIVIKYEEISLTNRDLFIFFEISIDIFTKIKSLYKQSLEFNFCNVFIPQYIQLMGVIEKSGIFNENLLYLIRTLPLLDGDDLYQKENIQVIKKLFSIVLSKFPNFFNEEIFVLFNIFLEKLEKYMTEDLVNEIIIAFNHKYTYKGSNLAKSKIKFYDVIYNNSEYCDLFIRNIIVSCNCFLDNFIKFNGQIKNFKEGFIEFIEKYDFYIKFIEYIKNKEEALITNKSVMLILVNGISVKAFLELGRCLEENVIAKTNEYINVLLELLFKLIDRNSKKPTEEGYKYLKSFLLVLYHNSYLINDYIFFLIENLRSTYMIIDNFKILEKIVKMFKELNEIKDKNKGNSIHENEEETLFKELNFMIKNCQSQSDFNKEKDFSIEIDIASEDYSQEMTLSSNDKLNMLKVFKYIWRSTSNGKELYCKAIMTEYMSLIEDANDEKCYDEHLSYFTSILNYFLNLTEETYNMFSLQLIIKYFNIKFEEGFELKLKEKVNLPMNIWEKIFNLIDDKSYKISIFSHYIIQILAPKTDINNLVKFRCEKLLSNEKQKLILNSHENSLIKFKLISKEINLEKMILSFWLKDEEILKIHTFIKEKIMVDQKIKSNADHNFPTIPSNPDKNDNNNFNNNDDEYLDLIKIPELINMSDDLEEKKLDIYEYEPRTIIQKRNNIHEETKMSAHDKKQKQILNNYYLNTNSAQNLNNLKNLKDDNVSLEELGVFEAEDEIFDNFDEENIPVIKNCYKRKKGSAEKLKTNQNTRNLLMSNHNVPSNNNNSNFIITANNISNQNKLLTNNQPNQPISNSNQQITNNTNNQEYPRQKNISNFYSKLLSSPKELNNNVINIENLDQLDTDQLPDLQSKKKNIRPQNGLRPATPPIKPISKSGNKNQFAANYNANINSIIKEQLLKVKPNENRRNTNTGGQKGLIDKKYEIKSMEELFIEEEPKTKENIYEINLNQEQFQNFNDQQHFIDNIEQLTKFNEYLYVDENNNLQKDYSHNNDNNAYIENAAEFENNNNNENEMKQYGDYYQDNYVTKNNNNDVESIAESLPMAEDYVGEEVYEMDNVDEYIDKKTKIDVLREAKSRRPPTRYGNREDQVLWNKFGSARHIQTDNNTNTRTKSGRVNNNLNMNNTFNQTKNNYFENKTISSPQEKNRSSQNLQTYLKASPPGQGNEDFRKNLQLKLSKNSNKIFENLRKLSENRRNNPKKSMSSISPRIQDYDSPYSDTNSYNPSDLFHHSSISSHNVMNAENKSKSPEVKKNNFVEETLVSSQRHKIKHNSYINTNISDQNQKFLIGSSTKTPSFNYHNSNKEDPYQK